MLKIIADAMQEALDEIQNINTALKQADDISARLRQIRAGVQEQRKELAEQRAELADMREELANIRALMSHK